MQYEVDHNLCVTAEYVSQVTYPIPWMVVTQKLDKEAKRLVRKAAKQKGVGFSRATVSNYVMVYADAIVPADYYCMDEMVQMEFPLCLVWQYFNCIAQLKIEMEPNVFQYFWRKSDVNAVMNEARCVVKILRKNKMADADIFRIKHEDKSYVFWS